MENQISNMVPESKEARVNLNKVDWVKVGIVLGVLIILVFAGVMIYKNLKPSSALNSGDSANFAFTFTVDGKLIAQNESKLSVGKIGENFGIDSSKIDDAVIGLKKGGEVAVTLAPSEAYGDYDPSRIETMNRTQSIKRVDEIDKVITIPFTAFTQTFNENPVLNKIYSPDGAPWDYKVTSFDNSSVNLSQEVSEGKILPLNELMFAKVVKVTSDKITTERNLNKENEVIDSGNGNLTIYSDKDYIYFKLTPLLNVTIPLGDTIGTVISFNDTSIVFDTNHPYAGKSVEIKLRVLSVQAVKKVTLSSDAENIAGAPTLDVFVMSYCPYGTQMEKGVIPAYETLKGKANFKIRFVSYTMHGQKEDDENARQICIREETKQFWPYLQCFLDKGEGTESACMKTVGIDEAKITDCMTNRASGYLEVDKQLNTQFGVQGSPTTVLDDKVVEIYPRSPQDVLNKVCEAFTEKPSECSTSLDSANPSPGFGFSGSSSSSSAASCG